MRWLLILRFLAKPSPPTQRSCRSFRNLIHSPSIKPPWRNLYTYRITSGEWNRLFENIHKSVASTNLALLENANLKIHFIAFKVLCVLWATFQSFASGLREWCIQNWSSEKSLKFQSKFWRFWKLVDLTISQRTKKTREHCSNFPDTLIFPTTAH